MGKREIYCLSPVMVIIFCGGLCGEEVFMVYLKGLLKFWEETSKKKE